MTNYFKDLSGTAIKPEWIEERQGFSYLSWAFAQEILGEKHPEAIIEVKEYGENGFPFLQTPLGYFVQVEVTINGVKRGRPFPVTDSANRPLGAEYWKKGKRQGEGEYVMNRQPTSFDINTAIQRSFVKACAEHGIGLYIYQGEDLPASVTSGRKDELLTKFAEMRQNDKTDKWFVNKETLLGQNMEEWDLETLENYNKTLDELKKQAEEKRKLQQQQQEQQDDDGEEKDASAEKTEAQNPRAFRMAEVKKLIEAHDLVEQMAGEYMTKLKKDTLHKLTDRQLKMLYDMAKIKEQTALKSEQGEDNE